MAEALSVPVDGGLDRVLVRRRAPAELALRLRVAVGPPLAREPNLLHAERPRARLLCGLSEAQRDGGRQAKRRRLGPGHAREVGEEAVEGEVAVAEDVALAHRAAL